MAFPGDMENAVVVENEFSGNSGHVILQSKGDANMGRVEKVINLNG